MTLQRYFATPIYTAALSRRGARELNARLLRACLQIRADDAPGRKWSARNYPNGYTSYGSQHRLHRLVPAFEQLQQRVDAHVTRFAAALEFERTGRELVMTDCWVNVMGQHATHGLHLHPHASISGTYYVSTPAGAPGLKFEDPRFDRFMAAPPRRRAASAANRAWITLPARAGDVILFESWLRHEVVANRGRRERVSISFNYGWF
jgi:uncharacterized protein (TIGR02466 family)